MTKVFVLAQGHGSRWVENTKIELPCEYKQFIEISKLPLINRTIKQLKTKTDDITVVALVSVFSNKITEYVEYIQLREPTGSILQTMIKLLRENDQEEDIMFILGDVIYSSRSLDFIFSRNHGGVTLYGRLSGNIFTRKDAKEIFAVRVTKSVINQIIDEMFVSLTERTKPKEQYKLWDLYYRFLEKGIDGKLFGILQFVSVDFDYTDDIDSPEEYIKFYEELKRLAEQEDKNQTWMA